MENNYLEVFGIILSCSGGLYSVETKEGVIYCKARGVFRNKKIKPVSGDNCIIRKEGNNYYLFDILPRQTHMIRPSLANIDTLFITFSPLKPSPDTFVIDKLIYNSIKNGIKPVLVITKSDLDKELTKKYYSIYSPVFETIITDSYSGIGIDALKNRIINSDVKICAFSGASGVGKSTIINKMFPSFSLESGELSLKIERGKNTTRTTSLLPVSNGKYIADTPGFTALDCEYLNENDDKAFALSFPEIEKCTCRWRNCTHTKEDGCSVLEGVENGTISKERYNSYILLKTETK